MKLYEISRFRYRYDNDDNGVPRIDNPQLAEVVTFAKFKARKKFYKEKKESKGNAEDGNYCPKEKTGQAWSHIKDTKKEEVDETLSDNTQN